MNKCIGCGAIKQTSEPNKSGYVLKLENEYCLRCFKIKNYNELIPQEINAKTFIEKLTDVLKNASYHDVEFYYILDIFDLEASRIIEIEKFLSKFNVNIVINKIDLMPKAVKLNKIRKYVTNIFANSDLKEANILLCSSLKQNFITSLMNKLKKNKSKKYFIGSSNVGKSSIINAILKANNLIPQIVVSKYFNTTLDFIEIKLDSETRMLDTPGVSRENSIANLMNHTDWKYIYFNKEIKQITYQLKPNNSIFFEALCWFDYKSEDMNINSFHIFVNPNINTHRTNLNNAVNYYEKNKLLLPINIKSDHNSKYVFKFDKKDINKEYDILISGLGWINFKIINICEIVINIPSVDKKVLVVLRKPLI